MVWQGAPARRVPRVSQDKERLVRVEFIALCWMLITSCEGCVAPINC